MYGKVSAVMVLEVVEAVPLVLLVVKRKNTANSLRFNSISIDGKQFTSS